MDYYKTRSYGRDRIKKHDCNIRTTPVISKSPNPSLWQKIKILVRLLTVASKRHPYSKYAYKSSFARQEEIRRQSKCNWLTIHPYSRFSYFWKILMCFVYVLVVGFEIVETTFEIDMKDRSQLFYFMFQTSTVTLNIVCVVDICLNFFFGYVAELKKMTFSFAGVHEYSELKVELRIGKIMVRYIRTYFLVDCIAFVNIAFYFGGFDRKLKHYFMLLRILRHARFKTVFHNVKMGLSIYRESSILYNIFLLCFTYYYVIFFLSCMIIYVPDMISYYTGKKIKNSLVLFTQDMYKRLGRNLDGLAMYGQAKILTMHDLMVISPEYNRIRKQTYIDHFHFFLCLGFSLGLKLLFFTVTLDVLHSRYKYQLAYTRLLYQSTKLEVIQNIDVEFREKMHRYYRNFMKGALFSEKVIMNSLTPHLRYEIFDESSMGLVKNCHLFLGLPNEIVSSLAARLKLQLFYKGTRLIQFGTLATCMYFIASGTVAVYSRKDIEICHLCDGDYFGEIGLIRELSTQRVANVICMEYCEIYRLDVKDFQQVIKPTSAMYQRIAEMARRRLRQRKAMSGSTFLKSIPRRSSISPHISEN